MSIDACATALVLGEMDEALEVLEEGRALLLGDFDKLLKDLDRLEVQHIALFHRFQSVRTSILYGRASSSGSWRTEREELLPLLDPLGQVIKEIRSLSGFEDFLVPLTAKEIRGAAQTHPIVVLVGSILHQDAIVLSRDKVDHVDLCEAVDPEHFIAPEELRELSREDMSAIIDDSNDFSVRNHYLCDILQRLWKGVAEPISNTIGFEKLNRSPTVEEILLNSCKRHIIWMRTGDFHRLTINMALDGSSSPPTPFCAYATSSFTSSFRALLAGQSRQHIFKKEEVSGSIISMPPKSQKLSNGEQNMDTRSLRSRGLWIRNVYEECSRTVKEHSLESHFLHLICHGVSIPDNPMQSYLQLWDRSTGDKGRPARLTISQIAQWNTSNSCLAFLSSCSMADAAAPALYEENLDVCNALNLAGICDVVGSMWPIPDKVGAMVAEGFWSFINLGIQDGENYDSYEVAMALNAGIVVAATKNPGEALN
ncbi:hypothetical protein JMJ35_008166 [Cladonia borealis]|uniref:CHAT domain-containing protein n=1 Tax=Cladonia borealis TaxID=184061 RepID=A0AA39UZI2_9LECA|nr:hypothetical protein JMJ35_008166 [Cladonia borealis]